MLEEEKEIDDYIDDYIDDSGWLPHDIEAKNDQVDDSSGCCSGYMIWNIKTGDEPLDISDGSSNVYFLIREAFSIGPILSCVVFIFQLVLLYIYLHDFKHVEHGSLEGKNFIERKIAMTGAFLFFGNSYVSWYM